MKRILLIALLCVPVALWSQEHAPAHPEGGAGEQKHEKAAHEEENPNEIYWKWANFLMLVGALGYLIVKQGGPLLAARTAEIQKGIVDSTAMRNEAEQRARAVEARLANLQGEVETLRQSARQEMSAEAQRLQQETSNQIARIQAQSQQELAAAAKTAQQELRSYSAQLALNLAEQKIRQQLNPQGQDELVRSFLGDLEKNAVIQQQKGN